MNKILDNIESIRGKRKYSQEYVAEKLGMKQSSYSRIFNVQEDMKLSTLLQICDILDVSLVDVITYPNKFVPESEVKQECPDCIEKDRIIRNLNNYIESLNAKQSRKKKKE